MTLPPGDIRSDQLAPHSAEAEEAVLGCVLLNPGYLEDIQGLEPDDFFIVRHAWIYEAMRELHRDKQGIDFLTVVAALEQKGRLAEIGGGAYVLSLINKTPSAMNIEGYARIVQNMATRRRLLEAASQIAMAAHSDQSDLQALLSRCDSSLKAVTDQHTRTQDDSGHIDSTAILLLSEAKHWREKPEEIRGMKTGLVAIDKALGGIRPGKMILVAGRPGMGKSSLLAQLAVGLAQEGHPVLFFSLEMDKQGLVQRMACQLAKVDSNKLERGTLSAEEFKRFEEACLKLTTLPIYLNARSGLSVGAMRSIAARHEREFGVEAVFVDTLNRVASDGKTPYEKMTNTSHAVADWAHDSPYAVFCAAQLSRDNTKRTDKRPTLSDLRDAGALEEDGDLVIGLHRQYYYQPEKTELEHLAVCYLLKNRYGSTDGDVELHWDASYQGFGSRLDEKRLEGHGRPSSVKLIPRAAPASAVNGKLAASGERAPTGTEG